MVTGWLEFRPPSGLGTIPHRGLVPWLSAGMVLSNGMKLALDWPGLALDLLGLALIDHFLEIGELILDRKVDLGLASDWHRIGSGLAKKWISLALDWRPICIEW